MAALVNGVAGASAAARVEGAPNLNLEMEDFYLGAFEEIVLLAICGIDGDVYAVTIQQHIEERAGRPASVGSVYRTLNRLEKKGFVKSWMGDVTRVRGGKRKRFYQITSSGRARLLAVRESRSRLWKDLELKPSMGAG